MIPKPEPLPNALAGLRNPHGDQKALMDQLSTIAKATGRILDAKDDIAAKQAAGLVARVLFHHSDTRLMTSCLTVLMQSGKAGRVAARRQIQSQSISLQELAAVTQKLRTAPRLLLAHEFLCTLKFQEDKPLLQWLEALTDSLRGAAPEKLLNGLAVLGREGVKLAYPVKRLLLDGGFAPWFRTVLSSPIGKKDIEPVSMALIALSDRNMNKFANQGLASGAILPDKRLINTLCSLAAPDDADLAKALQKLLKRTEFKAAQDCLAGFLRMGWPHTGEMLTLLLAKQPKKAVPYAALAPLLTEYGMEFLLRELPPQNNNAFLAHMFTAIAVMDPDFLAAQLKTEPDESVMYAAQLKAFVSENAATLPETPDGIRPSCSFPTEEETRPSLMGRILGDKRQALAKRLDKGAETTGQEFPDSILRKTDLKRKQFKGNRITNAIFDSVSFFKVTFRECDLSDGRFKRARFTECTFNDCRLDRTRFEKTSFQNCEFLYSDFRDATLAASVFNHCAFKGAIMPDASLVKTDMTQCTFDQCFLTASRCQDTRMDGCTLLGSDLSHSSMVGAELEGCEFIDSSLNHSTLVDCHFPGTDFTGCTIHGSRIRGVRSDHPFLIQARLEWLHEAAIQLTKHLPPLPETAMKPEAAPTIHRAAVRWIRQLDFARREASMLRDNRMRSERGLHILGDEKARFIRLLPYILHTDLFDQKLGISQVPICTVAGYTPNSTTLKLAREIFPGLEPGHDKPTVMITGLYTMGSYGSVAQTAESDIDCWVCISDDTATRSAMQGLRKKLDALTLWADLQFNLEAHFFPMSEENIRQNNFGYSDKESSGSAQAILLKEEFYRSALKLAGKNLAWWVIPAGASRKIHEQYAREAIDYPITGENRIVDLGPLDTIPPGEFFGAAMWQIVKALHSPFKSVMKLGLLDIYSGADASGGMPLCDTIKGNVFNGVTDIQHIDSYTALFRALRKHYTETDDTDAVTLLTESFVSKADFNGITMFLDHPDSEDGRRMVQTIFGEHTAVSGRTIPQKKPWNFSKSLKTGEAVSRFMTATYQRIQKELHEDGGNTSAMITPEDMTRLGRRIAANFAKKKNKVTRVPFMDVGKNAFSTLQLSAIKKPGKKTVWVVQGSQKSEGKSSVREMQVLRRDYDPAMLLSWVFFNGLYTPNVLIQADRTIAPLAVADIQKLFASMHQFFPLEETFERDIDEGLEPEQVIRALFVLNMTAPHDLKRVDQATIVYSTTWGEVFCETFDKPDRIIEAQASTFLHKMLKRPLHDYLEMESFIPKGSHCTRIKLI